MNLKSKKKVVKRSKGYFGVIPLSIFNTEVLFSINQTDDQLKKSLQTALGATVLETNVIQVSKQEGELNTGKTIFNVKDERCLIRVYKSVDSPGQRGTLSHEIMHAVHYILNNKGFELTDSSEEAYAYLTGFITTQIYYDLP